VDNLTHSLVGLAAAKAGLGRTSPYATFVCVAAANAPDADIVALAGGPSYYLANHRGITHSIVGTLALGVALPLIFFACERLAARLGGRVPRARLKGLMVCSLLLAASHPLLDWTNSYGVRPFLPWDGRWVYGDVLFVVDPWLWLALGGACFVLTACTRLRAAAWALLAVAATALFFLAGRGAAGVAPVAYVFWLAGLAFFLVLHLRGAAARFGGRVAAAGLAFVVVYCGALALLHARARETAEQIARELSSRGGERLTRVAATPLPVDPRAWRCLAETDRSTFRFDVTLGGGDSDRGARDFVAVEKPSGEAAALVARASTDARARVLLDFARFPVARVRRGEAGGWVVQLADLRFTEPGTGARPGSFALEVPVE
jgi:inner membrane protein